MTNAETVYMDAELFIVTNEDGNITADADRNTAIARMHADYGGEMLRVLKLSVKVPRPRDYLASITLHEEDDEMVYVESAGVRKAVGS